MEMEILIHTPTPGLEKSVDFYSRLGFEMISKNDPTVFTDGQALVEINPDRTARTGVKIYGFAAESMSGLRESTEVLEVGGGFAAADPNGIKVYLSHDPFPLEFERKETSSGLPGNYAGLCIEAHSPADTVKFWESIGFEFKSGDIGNGYASYGIGDFEISIMKSGMCPHLFFNPSMTYFNHGKNLENIGKIRETGISIAEEITAFNEDGIADNIIIQDPGGLGFFVFND